MSNLGDNVTAFDPRAASQHHYAALAAFDNRLRAERLPDDPPTPQAELIARWQHTPPFVAVSAWSIWDAAGTTIIAHGEVSFLHTEENKHVVWFNIQVTPEWRRQGLGRRLLAALVQVPQREQRRLMTTETNDRVPAGAAFMERLGAKRGIAAHTNQLILADLDRNLLRQWQERAGERAAGFELGLWVGPYPAEHLAAVVSLHEVMNTEPRDDLDVEDFHVTPEHIRQMEQSMVASGTERWTMYARERATGAFVGFTEVFWNANRAALLFQGATAVAPSYRGRGLGRWLKAAMLEKVLQERPMVRFVRTGNADSNDPMLHINHALGYKPFMSECVWQVETAQVAHYLSEAMAELPSQATS
ncbi:MAG: GNAT family N-acetyltransferase [Chloroflexota bacterium]|nr:GNAT family N-acetyltransferase [Chloroflexota bacterium]